MAQVTDTGAASLAACVAYVLGVDPSEVPGDGGVGLRQWLAGRGLGLVPVAEPVGFEWPGRFLGRRRVSATWAVFFGAPPGIVFDPAADGEAECFGQRRCEPCAHLERLTRPGVLRGLVHRGGLRADVLSGGEIRVGDRIEATES